MLVSNSNFRRARAGFTLVELLVVIAIIAVLMGLLFPAVQSIREAARRTTCKNNLRQVLLAVQNYESSFQRFPRGWEAADPTINDDPGWGWASRVLPYMEQTNLYDQIRFDLPIGHVDNGSIVSQVVPSFLCPSDPTTELPDMFHTEAHGGAHLLAAFSPPQVSDPFVAARGNFSGVFGISEIEDVPDTGEGIFFRNSKVRPADVADGLSNTLMIGERVSDLGGVTWLGVIQGIDEPMARIVATADHVPNFKPSDPSEHRHFEDFRSHHTVGVNFGKADGSIEMISNTIDLDVYQAMCTRAGREVVSDDF